MMTLTSTNNLSAQKATTNASYAAGSLMDSVNHSELGQNSSLVLNKAKRGGRFHTKSAWAKYERYRLRNTKRDKRDR